MEIHEFKQLKLAFKGANEYEYARLHNELPDFYFGRGKYYHLDYESKYEHYALNSYEEMKKYADKIGKENVLPLFIDDIEVISKNHLTIKDLFYIFYFLYVMAQFKYENQLQAKLQLSQSTLNLLKAKVHEFELQYGDHIKEGERYDDIADIRAWPPNLVNNCKKNMLFMSERFGYNQFVN